MDTAKICGALQPALMLVFCGLTFSAAMPESLATRIKPSSRNSLSETLDTVLDILADNRPPLGEANVHHRAAYETNPALDDILEATIGETDRYTTADDSDVFTQGQMDMLVPESLADDMYDLDLDFMRDNEDEVTKRLGMSSIKRSRNTDTSSITMTKRLFDKRSYDMYTMYLKQLMKFLSTRNARKQTRKNTEKRRPTWYRRYDTLDSLGSGLIGR